MALLGILGGMSWESSASYYRLINEGYRDAKGGLHSAPLLLHSVDFASIAALQKAGDWQAAGVQLSDAARGLERAGAGAIVLATNTMHKVADAIEQAVEIPLLHIGDAVGEALQAGGFQRVALLGTRFTMQQDFYRLRLAERYGIEVVLPEETQMTEIDRIIFSELCQGQFTSVSRAYYLACLESLHSQGAQAAILGCTEIGLLLQGVEAPLPLIDSTQVHVQSGLRWLLGRSGESDLAKT